MTLLLAKIGRVGNQRRRYNVGGGMPKENVEKGNTNQDDDSFFEK